MTRPLHAVWGERGTQDKELNQSNYNHKGTEDVLRKSFFSLVLMLILWFYAIIKEKKSWATLVSLEKSNNQRRTVFKGVKSRVSLEMISRDSRICRKISTPCRNFTANAVLLSPPWKLPNSPSKLDRRRVIKTVYQRITLGMSMWSVHKILLLL